MLPRRRTGPTGLLFLLVVGGFLVLAYLKIQKNLEEGGKIFKLIFNTSR